MATEAARMIARMSNMGTREFQVGDRVVSRNPVYGGYIGVVETANIAGMRVKYTPPFKDKFGAHIEYLYLHREVGKDAIYAAF